MKLSHLLKTQRVKTIILGSVSQTHFKTLGLDFSCSNKKKKESLQKVLESDIKS